MKKISELLHLNFICNYFYLYFLLNNYIFIFIILFYFNFSSYSDGENGCEDPTLIFTSLSINELNSFMVHILTDDEMIENETFFGQNLFERTAVNVLQHFCLVEQNVEVQDDILFEENCSNVELSSDEVSDLSDKTIEENFSNQNGQLVCLVCYKIFSSDSDFSNFRTHLSTHSLSGRKLRQLLKLNSNQNVSDKKSKLRQKELSSSKKIANTFEG